MTRALAALAALCLSVPAFAQSDAPPPPPPPPVVIAQPLPPPPPPPPLEPEPRRKGGFSAKLSLGGTYRLLYGISFGGADLGISLGGQTPRAAFYANLGVFLGSTLSGLTTSDVQVGFTAEGLIGERLRLGGGAQISLLLIRRITNESTIFDFTVGPVLLASFDLVRWDDAAFFVGLRGGAGWLVMANDDNSGVPFMGHASLNLGFRL